MSRLLGVVTAFVILGLGCERASPPAAAATTQGDPAGPGLGQAALAQPRLEGSHVVVAAGAHFYASASASEPIATRSFLDVAEIRGSIGANHVGWVMRLGHVGDNQDNQDNQDNRVQVTLLEGGDPAHQCGRGMEGLDNFELTWWVDRSSLLPVTTELTTLRFDDGTSVRLPSGVPILPATADAPARVSAWGFELPLTGGESAPVIGLAFEPVELPAFEPGGSLPPGGLQLAGAPLNRGTWFSDGPAPVSVRDAGGQTFVKLRGGCVELEALAKPEGAGGLGSLGTIGGGGGGYGGSASPRFFAVSAGTSVRWPDGSIAGQVRADARLYPPTAPGTGHCGYFSAGDQSRDVALCFADADIRQLPLGSASISEVHTDTLPSDGPTPAQFDNRIRSFASSFRVPCVSHAVEANPLLDARMQIRVVFGSVSELAEVGVEWVSGEASEQLRECIGEQVGSWRLAGMSGAQLEFELPVGARGRPRGMRDVSMRGSVGSSCVVASEAQTALRRCCCLALLWLVGCREIPEVAYETKRFEIAPDFDHEICSGTLAYLDEHLGFVESSLVRPLPPGDRIRFYWITQDLDDWCARGARGCFYPGVRVIIGGSESVTHEMVHVVLNASAQTSLFLEEGLAELYSGVGARVRRKAEFQPDLDPLVWVTRADYEGGELDYSVAGHFVSWVNAELGEIVIRELATIVVEGGGARDLERALERYADMSFAQTEQAYAALDRNDYSGLRDAIVPELDYDLGIDVSLRCQDDTTFGPLPNASPGMYRTLRFELESPRVVEFQLFGGDDVRMDIIDVGAERLVGHIIDFHHPLPSGGIDHRVVRVSDRQRLAWLSAGTYLLYISQAGYGPSETILLASDLGPFNE